MCTDWERDLGLLKCVNEGLRKSRVYCVCVQWNQKAPGVFKSVCVRACCTGLGFFAQEVRVVKTEDSPSFG